MGSPREKLKAFRVTSGKTPEEVALHAGITAAAYYDLESCVDEIETAISLLNLRKIASMFGIQPSSIFTDTKIEDREIVSPDQLANRIKNHLSNRNISVSEFEDRVGFEIRKCLDDSMSILDWNVDCLRSVCQEVDTDWLKALPKAVLK